MAKSRIVVALIVFERTIAVGRDVSGAVRWLQKREAGEDRNKSQRECVRFHAPHSASFALHTATTKRYEAAKCTFRKSARAKIIAASI